MIALLDDLAVREHDDVVGMLDGGQAVCDSEHPGRTKTEEKNVQDFFNGTCRQNTQC